MEISSQEIFFSCKETGKFFPGNSRRLEGIRAIPSRNAPPSQNTPLTLRVPHGDGARVLRARRV